MKITEQNIQVRRTARYFTSGCKPEEAKEIWFLLHGYTNSAKAFLEKFTELDNGERLLVAPEGLSRFYTRGYNGPVGASWMTSEDRENEISDYVNYLDELLTRLYPHGLQGRKLIILGFSQGASTAARWAVMGEAKPDALILMGGKLPPDLPDEQIKKSLQNIPLVMIVGRNDQFIDEALIEVKRERMQSLQLNFHIHTFVGRHEVKMQPLNEIMHLLKSHTF